jgi:hypothetical protein
MKSENSNKEDNQITKKKSTLKITNQTINKNNEESENIGEKKINLLENSSNYLNRSINSDLTFTRYNNPIKKIESNYKILDYKETIVIHKKGVLFIKQVAVTKTYYIIGGEYNDLYIYDEFFEKRDKIKNNKKCFIENIYVNNKKDTVQIICCSRNRKETFLTDLNLKRNENMHTSSHYNLGISGSDIIDIDIISKHIFCGVDGIFITDNLFYKPDQKKEILKFIEDDSINGIFKISNNIVILIKNNINLNNENKLILYKISNKSIITEIKGPLIKSGKDCSLISISNKQKIVLCPCKKYRQTQRNGILFINILDIENCKNNNVNYFFYDTDKYEVNCFCPICTKKSEQIVENEDNINYFLIGGFHHEKNISIIKLVQIYNNENLKNIHMQDIVFDNKEFKKILRSQISCMIQSNTGNILISFYTGEVCLLSKPNLDFFLYR